MNITLVTPAPPRSRAGNRTTAHRWARILRTLGYRVRVTTESRGEQADLLIALHAWRSAASIAAFRERWPQKPLIVALVGTDLYRFIDTDPEPTLCSMALADRLVVLHGLAHEAVPAEHHAKIRVIHQSVPPTTLPRKRNPRGFDVCVVGHLRDEKDPLRAAKAARLVPEASRLRVLQFGRAYEERDAKAARREQAGNPRYRWHGEIPRWKLRRVYARCALMVLSSRMEGGANVISEAVVAGLPVLASDIAGNRGLLGDEYPGYFPVGDTRALSGLLWRCEREPRFLSRLERACAKRAKLFAPERERRSWAALIRELHQA